MMSLDFLRDVDWIGAATAACALAFAVFVVWLIAEIMIAFASRET